MDYRLKNQALWALLVELCLAQSADGLPGKLLIVMLLLAIIIILYRSASMHA